VGAFIYLLLWALDFYRFISCLVCVVDFIYHLRQRAQKTCTMT
jgi:hypothetical protein